MRRCYLREEPGTSRTERFPNASRLPIANRRGYEVVMAARKTSAAKKREPAPSETAIGRLSLQFEHFQTQLTAFGEGMQSMEERLRREMREMRDSLSGRVDVLELVVQNLVRRVDTLERRMEELEGRVARLELSVAEVKREIRELREQLSQIPTQAEFLRLETLERRKRLERLEKLEQRISALEARVKANER
jgi:chromosome segregation ATPase